MRVMLIVAGQSSFSDAVKVLDIQPELQEYYKYLNCSTIDVRYITIDGKEFSIICDDEGLFKDILFATYSNLDKSDMIFGNIIIEGSVDEEGNSTGLNDNDVLTLQRHITISMQNNIPAYLFLNR